MGAKSRLTARSRQLLRKHGIFYNGEAGGAGKAPHVRRWGSGGRGAALLAVRHIVAHGGKGVVERGLARIMAARIAHGAWHRGEW